MKPITQNQLKLIRSLHQKKFRDLHRKYILEGSRLIAEAVNAGAVLQGVFIRQGDVPTHATLLDEISLSGTPLYEASEKQIGDISDTTTPPGIMAVCSIENGQVSCDGNWLYFDGLRDPGNAGTLMRTAAWFGCKNVCFSANSVDPYNPKTVRSGMGAHFYLNIVIDANITSLSKDATLLGAGLNGLPVNETKINDPWVVAIGSEAHGLSDKILQSVHQIVTISGKGQGESLNAAIAGSIILYTLQKNDL